VSSPELIAPRLPWDAADPHSYYEARRRDGDVVWDDTAQAWLVVGYEAAREVLGGSAWTSDPAANPTVRAAMDPLGLEMSRRSMLVTDGATHQRLRGSVRDVFTRTFVTGLTAGVEAIASAVIDGPATNDEFDFMSRVALPLPIGVIAEWLHLEPGTTELLAETSPVIIRMLGALPDSEATRAGTAASAALMTEFLPLAADRRVHPRDDLLSFIAGDPDLELEDVVITAILLAVAGHETTANLLGNSIIRLLSPERDGTRLADRIDPTDPGSITELLRLEGPVQSAIRIATDDTTIGGVEISAGAAALVAVAAANRDPAVFDAPDEFRPDRTGRAPLTFGYGAHHCLGANLARLEFATALPQILARRPALVGAPSWRDTPAIRGPERVRVVFTAP
jgi:cytochrome P450